MSLGLVSPFLDLRKPPLEALLIGGETTHAWAGLGQVPVSLWCGCFVQSLVD